MYTAPRSCSPLSTDLDSSSGGDGNCPNIPLLLAAIGSAVGHTSVFNIQRSREPGCRDTGPSVVINILTFTSSAGAPLPLSSLTQPHSEPQPHPTPTLKPKIQFNKTAPLIPHPVPSSCLNRRRPASDKSPLRATSCRLPKTPFALLLTA